LPILIPLNVSDSCITCGWDIRPVSGKGTKRTLTSTTKKEKVVEKRTKEKEKKKMRGRWGISRRSDSGSSCSNNKCNITQTTNILSYGIKTNSAVLITHGLLQGSQSNSFCNRQIHVITAKTNPIF
jgi:hypothetical protein